MLSMCTISTQRGSLPLTAKLCISSGSIEIEARPLTRSVSPMPGNEKQQRDARIAHDVAEAVDAVVAGPVGDSERLVVEDTHKTGRVAFAASSRALPGPQVATATNGAASISLR